MVNVGTLFARLVLRDTMTPALMASSKVVQKHNATITKLGKTLLPVSLAFAALGVASVAFATNLNKSMANVATLIPGNTKRVEQLKGSVQDLAKETGKATGDLSDGLYQVISAFGDSEESVQRLEVATKAAVAGVATTTDAINLISAVTKGYGDVTAKAQQKAADLAFMTVKLGQTTFPEMAASMGASIPIAASLNVAQEELFASFSTLTGVTGNAAEVTTQMKAAMNSMLKPTEEMKIAIKRLGAEGAEDLIQKSGGLVKAMRAVISTTDGSKEALSKLFPSIRALPAVIALTSGQADTFDEKLHKIEKEGAGAAEKAFKEISEGVNKTGHEFEKAKQVMVVTLQKLGDALMPVATSVLHVFTGIIEVIEKAVTWFGRLPAPARNTAAALGLVTTAAGPSLIALGSLGKLVTSLSTKTKETKKGLKVMQTGVKELYADLQKIPMAASAANIALKGLAVAGVAIAAYEGTRALTALGDQLRGVQRIPVKASIWDLMGEIPSLASEIIEKMQKMGPAVKIAFNTITAPIQALAKTLSLAADGVEALGNAIYKTGASPEQIAKQMANDPLIQAMKKRREEQDKLAKGGGGKGASPDNLGASAESGLFDLEQQRAQLRAQMLPDMQREIQLINLQSEAQQRQIRMSDYNVNEATQLIASTKKLAAAQRAAAMDQHNFAIASQLAAAQQENLMANMYLIEDPLQRQIVSIQAQTKYKLAEIDANRSMGLAEKDTFKTLAEVNGQIQENAARHAERLRILNLLGPSHQSVAQSLQDLTAAMRANNGIIGLSTPELGKLVGELRGLEATGKLSAEGMATLALATDQFRAMGAGVEEQMLAEGQSIGDANAQLDFLERNKWDLIGVMVREGATLEQATQKWEEQTRALEDASDTYKGGLGPSLKDISRSYGDLQKDLTTLGGLNSLTNDQLKTYIAKLKEFKGENIPEVYEKWAKALEEAAKRGLPETNEKLKEQEEQAAATAEKIGKIADKISGLGDAVSNSGELLSSLGLVSEGTADKLGEIGGALGDVGSAASGFATAYASGDIIGMASSAIQGATALVGLGKALFGVDPAAAAADEAVRDFGVTISDELAQQIADLSEEVGGRFQAMLLSITDIAEDSDTPITNYTSNIIDLMNAIEMGVVPATEGFEQLNEVFAMMSEEAGAFTANGEVTDRLFQMMASGSVESADALEMLGQAFTGLANDMAAGLDEAAEEFGRVNEELYRSIAAGEVSMADGMDMVRDNLSTLGDAMMDEVPGAMDEFNTLVADTFKYLEEGAISASEANETLGQAFETLGDAAEAGLEGAQQQMLDMILQAREMGQEIPEIAAYVNDQLGKAIGGLENLPPILTPEDAASQAAMFAATWQGVVAEQGIYAAIDQMGDAYARMSEQASKAGVDIGAMMGGGVGELMAASQDEVLGPLLEGVDALSQVVGGLGASGYLTSGALAGGQQQAMVMYDRLTGGDLSADAIARAMGPMLADLSQTAAAYGEELTPEIQALMDQLGIQAQEDPAIKTAAMMESSVELQTQMVELLGGTVDLQDKLTTEMPEAIRQMGDMTTWMSEKIAASIQSSLRDVTEYGGGGFVAKPQLAVVGDAVGGEYIVPASDLQNANGSSSITPPPINLTIPIENPLKPGDVKEHMLKMVWDDAQMRYAVQTVAGS